MGENNRLFNHIMLLLWLNYPPSFTSRVVGGV